MDPETYSEALLDFQRASNDLHLRFTQARVADQPGPDGQLRALGGRRAQPHIAAYETARATILAALKAASADGTLSRLEKSELRAAMHAAERAVEGVEQAASREREVLTGPALPAGHTGYGGSRPFKDFGDFAASIVRAGQGEGRVPQVDDRLLAGIGIGAAPSSWGNESVGSDGGFAVPQSFHDEIGGYIFEEPNLLDWCAEFPISGNSIDIPIDEASPWGGESVQVGWGGEGGQIDPSKPKLEQRHFSLKKLSGLVPCSAELVEDSAALGRWLPRKLGAAVRWAVNQAIIAGSGAGRPLGFSNGVAVVEQAKVGSQPADTIVASNVTSMYGRCTGASRAIWLVNPDAFPQIPLMTIGQQPCWTPPAAGMKEAPHGHLLGRPILLTDGCSTLGDAGDIWLCDLQQYGVISKGGPKLASSMHLWFDYDLVAFRIIFRFDGAPLVRSVITPPNSALTRSPFVRLAARA